MPCNIFFSAMWLYLILTHFKIVQQSSIHFCHHSRNGCKVIEYYRLGLVTEYDDLKSNVKQYIHSNLVTANLRPGSSLWWFISAKNACLARLNMFCRRRKWMKNKQSKTFSKEIERKKMEAKRLSLWIKFSTNSAHSSLSI